MIIAEVKCVSTAELFDCAIYSLQACHCSSKFLSVRQISKIHREAQGREIGGKEKKKEREKKKTMYHIITLPRGEIHPGPVFVPMYNLRATSLTAQKIQTIQ